MYLNEFGFSQNLDKVLKRLHKTYGIDLNKSSIEEVKSIYEHYYDKKINIIRECDYASYYRHPDYAQAVLICEAIKLFLSEIAPGRLGKKVVRRKRVSESNGGIIQPDVPFVDNPTDYFSDAGQSFDGDDLSGDYADDRDPSSDGSPHYDYDYTEVDKWLADKFVIEPETGDADDSSNFSNGEEADAVGDAVANRYYDTPGPDASDYAPDRNIADIHDMMDGPGYHADRGDVIDQLHDLGDPPGEDTKTGLPSDLEQGLVSKKNPTRKNGVVTDDFHSDPRKHENDRELPDPNDLQKENNKKMYEDRFLAGKMIAELNRPRSIGKIFEAAGRVAAVTGTDVACVLTAFENSNITLLESVDDNDPVYNNAIRYALGLIGNRNARKMLEAAQQTFEGQQQLSKFLINKANKNGYVGSESKRFSMAVSNAINNTDLSLFDLN